MARARGIKQPHPLVSVTMVRTRGIKQRHPLGSVRSRSGVAQLTAASGIVTSGLPGAKISGLPAASAANDTDQFEVNQAGTSMRVTVTQLVAAVAAGNGTVTSTSVVSANGLAGTVATPTTTPAITLSTTVNGMVKGNGTALSAAVAGTDYLTAADVVTPSYPDNDTSIATTEYVTTAIAAIPLVGTLLAGNWNYNSAALVPPPASGRVRLSVAWPPTLGASIHLYIHNTDIDSLVYTWVLGPNVNDQLILRSASGARLDGIVTAKSSSTYLDVTITVTAVSGSLSNNSRCQIAAVQASYLPLIGGTLAGPGNLAVGGTLGVTGALTGTTATFSGNVTYPGAQLQTVSTQTGAVATGTTLIPIDDTIPQIGEGDQYMSLAITPESATSKLIIDVLLMGQPSIQANVAVALFQDSTANALAAVYAALPASAAIPIVLRHTMTSGTTSATTFRVRAGLGAAGTMTFNGFGGARIFGGVMASSIVIQEIA